MLSHLMNRTYACPSVCSALMSQADMVLLLDRRGLVDRVVLAADPGTQTGWALLLRTNDGGVVPVASWILGRRSEKKAGALTPARAPTFVDQLALVRDVCAFCAEEFPAPVIVCEDWFAGPNPNTVRDVVSQFYFIQAAADAAGLTFRAVHNQTWKKSYLGRGNMKTADALVAYSAKGYEAHGVERWGRAVNQLTMSDDAAALGVAHHYISTEAT